MLLNHNLTLATYQEQLSYKNDYIKQLFHDLPVPDLEVFCSPDKHYRMRAEFRVWHEQDDLFYAMFRSGEKMSGASLIRCDDFPAASQAINNLMPKLLEAVKHDAVLREKWYAVEFLSTLSGDMLVTMIYHKKLDDHWRLAAEGLQDKLNISIIGRSRGQKVVLSRDFVTEALEVGERTFHYRQIEGGFTQPNAEVCQHMLKWAVDAVAGVGGDLLELYCGNGNFTLPLSTQFERVLATEISKTSVYAAEWNIEANDISNIAIVRLSAEELTEALSGERRFRRLEEQQIDLNNYHFSTVFVDPPRAGVDDNTLQLIAQYEYIVYISCNPVTLHANLEKLVETHQIVKMALFDQFPFTPHIESGVLLQRKL